MNPGHEDAKSARRPGGARMAPANRGSRRRGCRHAAIAVLLAFVRARDGGALLVGGMLLLAFLMIPAGAAMSNYAWREAQWEELRAAGRAAVAAAGPLLAGAQRGEVAPIQERVAAFSNALVPGMNVEAEDVGVAYDAGRDATTVTIEGTYKFGNVWAVWDDDDDIVQVVVKARLEQERYEIAAALDISASMTESFRVDGDSGTTMVKLDGLKTAMGAAVGALSANQSDPGSMLVSVVPFTSLVNAADTCNADPRTGRCRAARSTGKERYVRMLAGVRDTMDLTLADARAARDAGTGGHWVDSFHQYGVGTGLGPLRRQFLPKDLLDNRDWNLRRTDVDIDVSAQIPRMATWTVDDEDFWNGCLMARWGAYWNPDARPADWRQTEVRNWPATAAVAGWTPASPALPATTPLHVSDSPPAATSPNTLFTAYSWPDARISGDADHLLQGTMQEMLNPNARLRYFPADIDFADFETEGDNDWSRQTNSGGVLCPEPVTPLTDDAEILRAAVDGLAVPESYWFGNVFGGDDDSRVQVSATHLHLGVVWGLRTLSPLWSGVWDVQDSTGRQRPVAPCASGEVSAQCQIGMTKSILIISDGTNTSSWHGKSRTPAMAANANHNPDWNFHPCIRDYATATRAYRDASGATTPANFNGHFKTPRASADWVDANDRLNSDGIEHFADAYLRMASDAGNTGRRTTLINTLTNAFGTGVAPTPWQLFRGRDESLIDVLVASDSGFLMSGRPVLIDDRCRPSTMFGPYGRLDDFVYVGDTGPDGSTPPVPVSHAPFEDSAIRSRLRTWFLQACRLAADRGVRVNAVFMGVQSGNRQSIDLLERCVDAAGGSTAVRNVYITPTADTLATALREIFTHRRNLRFLD